MEFLDNCLGRLASVKLLEGYTVHLASPKNFCKQDIEFSRDTPFFATADAPLIIVKGHTIDQTNAEMMRVRGGISIFGDKSQQTNKFSYYLAVAVLQDSLLTTKRKLQNSVIFEMSRAQYH